MRIKVLSIVLFVDHRNFNSIVHKLYVLMPIFFWSVGSTSGSSSWWGQHCLLHHTISCGPHLTSKLRRPNTIIVTHIHSRIPARERRAKGQGWHQMPKGGGIVASESLVDILETRATEGCLCLCHHVTLTLWTLAHNSWRQKLSFSVLQVFVWCHNIVKWIRSYIECSTRVFYEHTLYSLRPPSSGDQSSSSTSSKASNSYTPP